MFYLLKVYQTALKTHPIFVQAAQTALLMSSGDVIAQFCTEKRRLHNYDFRRTFNFFVAGFFIVVCNNLTYLHGSMTALISRPWTSFDQLIAIS